MLVRERILKPWRHKNGYLYVTLSKGGKEKSWPIHVLVLEAYSGTRPRGAESRHFPDRSKDNNTASNLRWGTSRQNSNDMVLHGTTTKGISYFDGPKGETHPFAKLSDNDVRRIRRILRRRDGIRGTGRELARRFKVTEQTICDIKHNRIRKGA
jgi:hypothetical protein